MSTHTPHTPHTRNTHLLVTSSLATRSFSSNPAALSAASFSLETLQSRSWFNKIICSSSSFSWKKTGGKDTDGVCVCACVENKNWRAVLSSYAHRYSTMLYAVNTLPTGVCILDHLIVYHRLQSERGPRHAPVVEPPPLPPGVHRLYSSAYILRCPPRV